MAGKKGMHRKTQEAASLRRLVALLEARSVAIRARRDALRPYLHEAAGLAQERRHITALRALRAASPLPVGEEGPL